MRFVSKDLSMHVNLFVAEDLSRKLHIHLDSLLYYMDDCFPDDMKFGCLFCYFLVTVITKVVKSRNRMFLLRMNF